MKIVIFILVFIMWANSLFAQYIIPQKLGSSNTIVGVPSPGALQAALINTNFLDTTAANLTPIKFYPGAQVYTTIDNKFHLRNSNATAWIETVNFLVNSNLVQLSSTIVFDINNGLLDFGGLGKLMVGTNNYTTVNSKMRITRDTYAQNALYIGDSLVSTGPSSLLNVIMMDSLTTANVSSMKSAVNTTLRVLVPVPGNQVNPNNFFDAGGSTMLWRLAADSVRENSHGGDFSSAYKAFKNYEKQSGFTGRSIVSTIGENSIFEPIPSLIGGIAVSGPASNNWIRLRGWHTSMASYLLLNPFDTIDKYVGHMSTGFIAGKVLKLVDYFSGATGASGIDSAYGFVAPYSAARNFFNGTLAIGGLADNFLGIFRPVNNSSILDVASTTKGVLFPRMNTTQQNAIGTPATSLLIYNSDSSKYCFYNGASWVCMGTASGGGGSQGFQDVLTVNPDLSTSNAVDGGNNSFSWSNWGNYTFTDLDDFRIDADSELDLFAGDSMRLHGIDESVTTGLYIALLNPTTGALTKVAASTALTNIYNSNGTLSSDRTMIGSGNDLILTDIGLLQSDATSISFLSTVGNITINSTGDLNLTGDSLRFTSLGFKADTSVWKTAVYNTITKSFAYGPAVGGGSSTTWNGISNPTGDQALTFDAGESSTWTNSNTTEDLFTVNSSTVTTSSFFSLNRTSTALAAGNNIIELISSGANGTSSITATGLSVSITNTGTTSTNQALRLIASGGTTNIAELTTGTTLINDFSLATSGIATPAMAIRSTTNDVTGGIVLSNNANYANFLYVAAGQIQANDDFRLDVIGGDFMVNSARTFMGGSSTPTSTLHVGGSVQFAYVAKTTTYTATSTDYTIDCTSGTFTLTLPTAVGISGRVYVIKNSGVGVITLAGNSGQTFDGNASPTVVAGASMTIQSNNSNWIII